MKIKVFVLLFFLLLKIGCNAQEETNIEYTHVRWMGVIPQEESDFNPGFIKKISDFFFSPKPSFLSKPFSVYAKTPDSCWILDAGDGTINLFSTKAGEMPHPLKIKGNNYLSLVGICGFNDNNLLFTDSKLNKVFILNSKDNSIRTFKTKVLQQPTGIAYSSVSKTVWVVETAAHKISVFNSDGELLRTIGKRGTRSGEFNYPTYIWIDSFEKVYVVDALNFRIQIFNKYGKFLKSFGEAGDATGYFARPKGVATDSFGNIYVVDALFHTIQIFNNEGKFLYNFGTQGQKINEFWMPAGIYIDKNNYIYIADTYNSRIQIFQLINGK